MNIRYPIYEGVYRILTVVRPTDQGYDADRRGVFQARRMERPKRCETQPYRDSRRQVLSARREGGDS